MRFTSLVIILSICLSVGIKAQNIDDFTKDMKIVFSEGFSGKSIKLFDFSHPQNWMLVENGKSGKALKCKQIDVGDDPKSIAEMAFVKGLELNDCVVEFNFLQKGQDFSMRDVCLIFNYVDSLNYQYVQAASVISKTSHNFFTVVNGKVTKTGTALNSGMIWNYEKWQKIQFVRLKSVGKTQLFVDDQLVLETTADTNLGGIFGIGSYGSEIKIDNLKIWTPKE